MVALTCFTLALFCWAVARRIERENRRVNERLELERELWRSGGIVMGGEPQTSNIEHRTSNGGTD